jgi:hypothetical protein
VGKLLNGILGNYTGKIGKLSFYVRNGKQVVRTIGKMSKPPSEKQLQCYAEMAAINKFLKPLIEFVNAGFAAKARGTTKTPYNLALGYNKKYALQGTNPEISINYEKVLLTQGKLPEVLNAAVVLTTQGLSFSWEVPANLAWPRSTDQSMLLAYFPDLQKAVYVLAGASRMKGGDVLPLQPELLTEHMEVYISFVSENRREISTSTYLGSFHVS